MEKLCILRYVVKKLEHIIQREKTHFCKTYIVPTLH